MTNEVNKPLNSRLCPQKALNQHHLYRPQALQRGEGGEEVVVGGVEEEEMLAEEEMMGAHHQAVEGARDEGICS